MCRCIDCAHFDYWDGDWCCIAKFIILSGIDEKQCKTLNPENCERERECSDFEDDDLNTTPQRKQFRKEGWEFYRK